MNLGGNPVLAASRFDDDQTPSGAQPLQFRTSLSSMREAARRVQMEKDRMALGAGDGGALPLTFESNPAWDIWVEGRYSGFNDDTANLGRNGHVGLLFVGTDYRITPDVIVGGLVQWDWSKDEADAITTKVDGTGWMIGPYLSARVDEHIYVDLRAAWGSSWNDLNAGAANASFDTTRWLIKGTVSGNWQREQWRVTPSAELAYVKESQEAFTNSAGVFVAGQDVALGRLQFGPEVGYRFAHTPQLLIEPFAAIKGVWDWDNPNFQIIDGFVAGP
jgi:outer membrane autotransporter protein